MVDNRIYELKHTFIFKNYPVEVQITKGRRKIYYTKENIDKLPKKYLQYLGSKYIWNSKNRLYDTFLKEEVVKNINLINKPRVKQI